MTFCIGILVRDGLVALADTQIVKGDEVSNKAKLSVVRHDDRSLLLMTSGLRSIRDKAALRLEDQLDAVDPPMQRLHQVATAWGDQIKQVRVEDGASMEASGLAFNSHALIGGKLAGDRSPGLFLVYPEGNWINATVDSPSFIIGRSSYGKPILDRLLRYDTTLAEALALAYLAFDATRASVVDVDFPIDVVVTDNSGQMHRRRFDRDELADAQESWQEALRAALGQVPMGWASSLWSDASLLT